MNDQVRKTINLEVGNGTEVRGFQELLTESNCMPLIIIVQ